MPVNLTKGEYLRNSQTIQNFLFMKLNFKLKPTDNAENDAIESYVLHQLNIDFNYKRKQNQLLATCFNALLVGGLSLKLMQPYQSSNNVLTLVIGSFGYVVFNKLEGSNKT